MKQVQTMLDCVEQFTALADASESAAVPIETAGMCTKSVFNIVFVDSLYAYSV